MSKMSANQKASFAHVKGCLKDTEFAFRFNREKGISILAVYTGPTKTHYKIIVSHCGENDEFKKKIGFTECAMKYFQGGGVVLKVYEGAELDILIENFAESMLATWADELETM